MALSRTPRVNVQNQRYLIDTMGSAQAVYDNRNDLKSHFPDASDAMLQKVAAMDTLMPRCQQELEWARSKHVECLCMSDERYPARLRECDDAPMLLYYCGTANLNSVHIINMVGTRQCTEYGKELCRSFVAELARECPDCVVVSGLAYGIDINSHRAALDNGLDTVGVLAHGLDQIYPRMHQQTAVDMLSRGGLLTEYMSGERPDKMNFVARNRIVAGMCEATVVVESAARGGSLITAHIAGDYNRDVFAFPGRIHDAASAGCNALIAQDRAHLITSASDMMDILGWPSASSVASQRQQPVQRELFIDLTDEEQSIVQALQSSDGKAVNQLSIETNISIGQLSALLFNLEMKGLVKMMNGGMYRLLS